MRDNTGTSEFANRIARFVTQIFAPVKTTACQCHKSVSQLPYEKGR